VDLDLSNNALKEAPSSAFLDCEGLMRLVLSGNPISHVLPKAFVGLRSLTTLEMSNCGTEVIDKVILPSPLLNLCKKMDLRL